MKQKKRPTDKFKVAMIAMVTLGIALLSLAVSLMSYAGGSSDDPISGWLSSYAGFTVLVLAIYLSIRVIAKIRHGEVTRALSSSMQVLEQLERDHKWRRVKVVYIAASTIVVASIGAFAYQNSAYSVYRDTAYRGEGYDPSSAIVPVLLGATIAWVAYRFFLPRLYNYLKKPAE